MTGNRSILAAGMTILGSVLAISFSPACSAGRQEVEESRRLSQALGISSGMAIADVGAGNGAFSEELAGVVGPTGHVFSTEIEEDDVEDISERLEDAGLGNFTTILGGEEDTGLPENCCDVILLRLVYHHFTEPEKMRDSLRRALRPGGKLGIVDIRPQTHWDELEGVPDRGGHGLSIDDLIAEMTSEGWRVVRRTDEWETDENDTYLVIFN